MATVRLKYVYRDRDRQGRVRWRFRKPGCKAMTLRGAYGSPEFMANYQTVISEVEPIPKKGLGIAKAGSCAKADLLRTRRFHHQEARNAAVAS
jgi:hypothetical protein